ncbi:MAG: hypothetical protein M3N93_02460 [Acidobacteriota bacterium]|nr:hypothetical protein [Acidobacteriota bacterium]
MTRALCAGFILASWPAALLYADIIYSNFGPSDNPFNMDSGETVSSDVDFMPSISFTVSSNEQLAEVDFVTSIAQGGTNQVTIGLSKDSGGHPGTSIASKEFDGQMGVLGGEDLDPADPSVELSWIPTSVVSLTPGVTYWITLSAPAGANVTWNANTYALIGAPQFGDDQFINGSWQHTNGTLGAIQILDTAQTSGVPSSSPEPGTALLLGTGLIVAVGYRLRCQGGQCR